MLNASYSWSKTIGNGDSDIESTPPIESFVYYNRNRGVLNYDRTQTFNLFGSWDLPFGKGKRWFGSNAIASKVLSGWQINGIFTAMTGLPFSVTASGTSLNMPGNTQFADQVMANGKILGGTGPNATWFDPAAYAPVTQVRLGTSSINALRGPGLVNLDFGLFREFSISERFRLQFRGQGYNFTNTPHWALPAANLSAVTFNPDGSIKSLGGFGSITNTDASYLGRASMDERTFRFAVRLTF